MLLMASPSAPFGLPAAVAAIALLAASIAPPARAAAAPVEPAESVASVDPYYNPGESRGSFELIMKPYPIPVETTTYVNFVFNLPEDVPDVFHAVVGEVTDITYTQHLHHFVLSGCNKRFDSSLHGLPLDEETEEEVETECITPLGGWAPGSSLLGYTDMDTGILMGPALGTQAVMMNVHYTDGEYEDAAAMVHKMATDGIRIHYTTDFRPYSSRSEPLINVGTGAGKMVIPPGEPRFYLTRTCKVDTSCKDFTPERLRGVMAMLGNGAGAMAGGGEASCESMKPLCGIGGEFGPWIQRLCPASCGFCAATLLDGAPNPLTPEAYRVTGVNYHAHLLGREMYTTLLHDEEPETAGGATTSILKSAPITTAQDLESQDFWIYDYQETFPIDREIAQDDAVLQGTAVKPGDRIQVTCVYDSRGRDEDTSFDISTYDEMCITTVYVTFETPLSLTGEGGLQSNAAGVTLDLNMELGLLAFECAEDNESDMHVGTLAEDEDARDIWKDHPLGDAEGCTFPHNSWTLGQFGVRCPPELRDSVICGDREMLSDAIAGHTCTGGTLDGEDSNGGASEGDCTGGGGAYVPYTCAELEHFLEHDAEAEGIDGETAKFLVENWWAPKCCGAADAGEGSEGSEGTGEDLDQAPGSAQGGEEGSEGTGEDPVPDPDQEPESVQGGEPGSAQGGEEESEGSGEDSDQGTESVQGGEDVPSAAPVLTAMGTVMAALVGVAAAVPAILL